MSVIGVVERGCEPTYQPAFLLRCRSESTPHDRYSPHYPPQSHPSPWSVIRQQRSRSPCCPSPLLQSNLQAMAPPSFPPCKHTPLPSRWSALPIPHTKIDHRYHAPRA